MQVFTLRPCGVRLDAKATFIQRKKRRDRARQSSEKCAKGTIEAPLSVRIDGDRARLNSAHVQILRANRDG